MMKWVVLLEPLQYSVEVLLAADANAESAVFLGCMFRLCMRGQMNRSRSFLFGLLFHCVVTDWLQLMSINCGSECSAGSQW
jgi:hypothetical protein